MLTGLYIVVDDELEHPVYAEPPASELDEEVWAACCEAVLDALEGDGPSSGTTTAGERRVGWRCASRMGVSFVAVTAADVSSAQLSTFLQDVSRTYMDEVDDAREPDREGVSDIVIDVIAPWEMDE